MADIVEEFSQIDKKYKGFIKQLFGGASKAREEKMLAIAMHLQGLENSVSAGSQLVEKDFSSLARSLGDQSKYLQSSFSGLNSAEEQLKQISEKRLKELEDAVQKASNTLVMGQSRSSTELAGKLENSAAKLRVALEASSESLKQGNSQLAASIAQVSSSISQVSDSLSGMGERLSGMQDSLSKSMDKVEGKVGGVQVALSQSLDKTGKRVENIAEIAQALSLALGDFRAENKGQAKVVDEINKQVAKLETETGRLDEDLKQTGASLAGSLNLMVGEVTSAKQEIEGMEGEVRRVEDVVKNLPTETTISRRVRQELGKRLMTD